MQQRDPAALLSLINYCMTQVSTNMGVTEIYNLATEILGDRSSDNTAGGCAGGWNVSVHHV